MAKSSRFVKLTRIGAALVATLFGIATIKEGGSVLFIGGEAREAAGNYIPFILWFNFFAGFFYVVTGIGILRTRSWARWMASAIAGATLIFFALLVVHIAAERPYEMRTVLAMAVRSGVWFGIAFLLNGKLLRGGLLGGVFVLLSFAAHPSTLLASESELAKTPETVMVVGKQLFLNGKTVRTVSFLKIKAFAAGFYLEARTGNYAQILKSSQVKHIRVRFLKNVGKDRLARTWSKQIRESCQSHCDELVASTARLGEAFEDLSSGDLLEFTIYPGRLSISVKGQLKDSIPSASLAAAMLDVWVGPNPMSEDIKKDLLGGMSEGH